MRTQTLGELAARHPAATRVFLRHRLDFCCRGQRTLELACAHAGLDPAAIERELADEAGRATSVVRWDERPSAELADHIEAHYHAALRREVPALIDAARKVERVHAAKPDVPAGLGDELAAFWDLMRAHMDKEEAVLFPLIRAGLRGSGVAPPIQLMKSEHEDHAERLARIRSLTGGLHAPPHACATWRALYAGLSHLETELMVHIHLENNVLFPRALEG